VTFETGNAHTSKEFYDILDRNNALIYSLIPSVTGMSGYPGDNTQGRRNVAHVL
jgi:hypothetical protein